MESLSPGRKSVLRAGAVIGFSTIVVTMSFIGVLALVSEGPGGLAERIPFYLILMGLAFVSTILVLEYYQTDGQIIIVTASVIGFLTLVAATLSVEGALYSVMYPERVLVSQLVYYFVAAGLISTGLGFWAVNHWREFVGHRTR